MLTYSKTNLLLGCFNEDVFSDAKMNIGMLERYYKQDQFNGNNSLNNTLINIIKNCEYKVITDSKLISEFQGIGLSDVEINSMIDKVHEYKSYDKDQSAVFREDIKKACYQASINSAKSKYGDDVVGYTEYLKSFSYKSSISNNLVLKNCADLDITSAAKKYQEEGYKSSFKFINQSFTCGGYVPGQIVAICSPPGNGKSLFVEQESINFARSGKRVHMLMLGDLQEIDVAIRLTCMALKKPRYEVESNILGFFSEAKKYLRNISITCVPAGVVTAREYVDWIMQYINQFDVLVIDYDANFKKDYSTSMYDEYGQIYDKFTELSRLGKLIFVCTQPKIGYWGEEMIPLEALGESSRKQHIIDMGITIGRVAGHRSRCGKMWIVKSRKGDPGATSPWIGTSEGLFYEPSLALYAIYKSDSSRPITSYSRLMTEDLQDETNELIATAITTKSTIDNRV